MAAFIPLVPDASCGRARRVQPDVAARARACARARCRSPRGRRPGRRGAASRLRLDDPLHHVLAAPVLRVRLAGEDDLHGQGEQPLDVAEDEPGALVGREPPREADRQPLRVEAGRARRAGSCAAACTRRIAAGSRPATAVPAPSSGAPRADARRRAAAVRAPASIHVPEVDAVRDVPDRRRRRPVPSGAHISRATSPCSAETPFARAGECAARAASCRRRARRRRAPERQQPVGAEPARRRRARRRSAGRAPRLEDLVARPGTGVCVVNTVVAAHAARTRPSRGTPCSTSARIALEREERRVALVHVEDGRARCRARRAPGRRRRRAAAPGGSGARGRRRRARP